MPEETQEPVIGSIPPNEPISSAPHEPILMSPEQTTEATESGQEIPSGEPPREEADQPSLPTPPQAAADSAQTRPKEHSPGVIQNLLEKAREKIQFRKRAKLAKIMTLLETKESATNNDVEKLLRVSDATASRYLAALEREGKIRRTGEGRSLHYVRMN